ncbi:MAG: NAD-dependent epimerase/dehydratase family protein [Sandaracinaceae bacterium]|nr:NAD-dependent epimerase/dehydratase family protein [Sandaracinaceae bacterium]
MADVDTIGPRCLVTGGCGYLGRALVQRLLSLGCEVHTLDLAEAAPDPRARHFQGDLRDFASIAPAFEGVHTVFHSAALIATVEERFAQPALRRMAYAVNVVGTENVLRAARAAGVKALVHVSSINVVMDHAIDGGDETLPHATQAPDLYSRTKIAAERVALAADQPGGLRVCAIRPGGIWGPGRGGMMLDAMVAELAKGSFKATIGDGKTPLDNTHVDNVVDAALLAARALRTGRATWEVAPTSSPTGSASTPWSGSARWWRVWATRSRRCACRARSCCAWPPASKWRIASGPPCPPSRAAPSATSPRARTSPSSGRAASWATCRACAART